MHVAAFKHFEMIPWVILKEFASSVYIWQQASSRNASSSSFLNIFGCPIQKSKIATIKSGESF